MPYPFAHPAAVLPLLRFGVPSALVIGSIAPDLWRLTHFVNRDDSHSIAALFWFCLPAGLLCYVLFHLLAKEPLIALVSPRLGAFACRGLPRAPWTSVLVSLLVGAITHLAWDALTHPPSQYWRQHASTLAGSAILVWWSWRKLRSVPVRPSSLSPFARTCTWLAVAGAMAISVLWSADAWPALDRQLLKTALLAAFQGMTAALFVYCIVFQRKILRRAS